MKSMLSKRWSTVGALIFKLSLRKLNQLWREEKEMSKMLLKIEQRMFRILLKKC